MSSKLIHISLDDIETIRFLTLILQRIKENGITEKIRPFIHLQWGGAESFTGKSNKTYYTALKWQKLGNSIPENMNLF